MTEENVFHWDTDKLYREGMAELPEWARREGSCVASSAFPAIVPTWVRGDYQVGYELREKDYHMWTVLILYVRVRYPKGGMSKWMTYMYLYPRDYYLLPEIVEYLLSGNAERVYESFVRERGWKNRRTVNEVAERKAKLVKELDEVADLIGELPEEFIPIVEEFLEEPVGE